MKSIQVQSVLARYALPAAAAVSLTAAVLLAVMDHTASATLMAGLFAVSVLFVHFPRLEIFRAWGVEAKIARTLDEAQATLKQLQKTVELSARQTFWAIATQGMFSAPNVSEKNSFAKAATDLMKEIGLSAEAIRSAQVPFIERVKIDFLQIFRNCFSLVAYKDRDHHRHFTQQLRVNVKDPTYIEHTNRLAEIEALAVSILTARDDWQELKRLLNSEQAASVCAADDIQILRDLFTKIDRLLTASIEIGYFTLEAEQFVNEFGEGSGPSRLTAAAKGRFPAPAHG